MNKWIKQQLNKCNFDLPSYDDDTTNIIIPKKTIDNIVKKSKEK